MAELSDAEVFGGAPMQAAPQPSPMPAQAPGGGAGGPIVFNGGHGISVEVGGDQGAAPQQPQAPAPQEMSDADVFGAPKAGGFLPTLKDTAMDVGKSLVTGVENAGTNLTDTVLQATPLGQIPQMLRTAASLGLGELPKTTPFHGVSQIVDPHLYQPQTTPGRYAQAVGQMAPNVVSPGGLLRKAAAVVLPGLGSQAAGDAAEALGANPTVTAAARFAGGTLGGLGAGIGLQRAPKSAEEPMSLEKLQKASDDAWAKVDASGYRFPQDQVKSVSTDIGKMVAEEGGKELYPTAAAMAKRIDGVAAQGDLSVAQLNRLRSQVGSKLMQPGSTEADLGGRMKDKLDSLIETSQDPHLAEARDLYTRLKKTQAVNDRLESADLRSSATYSGGNYSNAVRQKLMPLIDPVSKQRMRNMTPAEEAGLRRVVEGTKTQNALREGSKLMGNRAVQAAAMIVTPHGVGLPMLEGAAKGMRRASEGQTDRAVQDVMQLMMTGGKPLPKGAPRLTYLPTGLEPFNLGSLLTVSQPTPSPLPVRGR